MIDISVAIATTKVPMLVERGFWAAAHEARTAYLNVVRTDVSACRWKPAPGQLIRKSLSRRLN